MHIETDHELDKLHIILNAEAIVELLRNNIKEEIVLLAKANNLRIVAERSGSLINGYVNSKLSRLICLITCEEECDLVSTYAEVDILSVDLKTVNKNAISKYTCACSRKELLKAEAISYLTVICLDLGCNTVIINCYISNNLGESVLVISIAESDCFDRTVSLTTECVCTESESLKLILNVGVSVGNTNLTGTDLLNNLSYKLISELLEVILGNLCINREPELAKINIKCTKLDTCESKINIRKCDSYLTLFTSEVLKNYLSEVDVGRILSDLFYDITCNGCLNTVCEVICRLILKNEAGVYSLNCDLVVTKLIKVKREGSNAILIGKCGCLAYNLKLHAVYVYSLDSLAASGCESEDVSTVTDNCVKLGRGIPVLCSACVVSNVNSRAGNGYLNSRIVGNVCNRNIFKCFLAGLVVLRTVVSYNNSCKVTLIKNFNCIIYVILNVDECAVRKNAKTHRLLNVSDKLSLLNVLNGSSGNRALNVGCRTKVNESNICLYCYRIICLVVIGGVPSDTNSYSSTVVESKKCLVGNCCPGGLCNVGGELNGPSTAVCCDEVSRIVLAKDLFYDLLCGRNLCLVALACLVHRHLSG